MDLVDIYRIIWKAVEKLSYPIFDSMPFGYNKYPYAYIGGLYTREDNTKNSEGLSCDLYINAYSAYKGRKEILEMITELNNVMKQDLSNDEYTVFIRKGKHAVTQDIDELGWGEEDNNKFYHAVLIYQIDVKKNIL